MTRSETFQDALHAYNKEKDYDKATKLFNEIITQFPDSNEAICAKALIKNFEKEKVHPLIRLLTLQMRDSPGLRTFALFLGPVIILLGTIVFYLAWKELIPYIYHWGFDSFSLNIKKILTAAVASLGLLFAGSLSIWLVFGPLWLVGKVLTSYLTEAETRDEESLTNVASGREKLRESFEDASKRLIRALEYRTIELEAYYEIALRQSKRGFNLSVGAMIFGFILLSGGLIVQFMMINEILGFKTGNGDMQTVVVGSGAIVEFIAALFLWVFRRTIQQLNYFYTRQSSAHNILLAFQVAQSMKTPDADKAKKIIIEKIMQENQTRDNKKTNNTNGQQNSLTTEEIE